MVSCENEIDAGGLPLCSALLEEIYKSVSLRKGDVLEFTKNGEIIGKISNLGSDIVTPHPAYNLHKDYILLSDADYK